MVKMPFAINVPDEEDILTTPEVAPGITIATSVFSEILIGIAVTPPILMEVVLFKLVPFMVSNEPILPDDG